MGFIVFNNKLGRGVFGSMCAEFCALSPDEIKVVSW